MHEQITRLINESIETKQKVHELTLHIEQTAQIIITALQNGKKVLACGNGGSAADAQHFVAELVGRFEQERKPLPAIALNTNVSTLTAIGNDYGYEELFARQINAFGIEGDVFIGISTSGKSPNILKAIDAALEKKMQVITLGGKDGGVMKLKPGIHVIVPSQTTSRIQECHILIIHIWCKLIDDAVKKFENYNIENIHDRSVIERCRDNKAVFLDRDGTILHDGGYNYKPEDLRFIPYAIDALKQLKDAGYLLIIVTSQSGIARGHYTEEDYHNFNEHFLKHVGTFVDAIYYCPHHLEGKPPYNINCDCRKPKTGMIQSALKKYHVDITHSWVIGDKTSDVKLGENAGCKTILVQTGKAGTDAAYSITPTYKAKDLLDAAKHILANDQQQ